MKTGERRGGLAFDRELRWRGESDKLSICGRLLGGGAAAKIYHGIHRWCMGLGEGTVLASEWELCF
jgi:hypothetical protein